MAVKLNTIVTDLITGFQGVAFSRTEFLNKCVRIGVMPKELKDGLPQDRQFFDEIQLKENDPNYNPPFNKWIGKVVTDNVTGVRGTVVSVSSYIYTASRLSIQPKGQVDGKILESIDVDEAQLKEYEEPAPAPKARTRTGGPGEKASLHRAAPRV